MPIDISGSTLTSVYCFLTFSLTPKPLDTSLIGRHYQRPLVIPCRGAGRGQDRGGIGSEAPRRFTTDKTLPLLNFPDLDSNP